MLTNTDPESGVDEWILGFPALIQFDAEQAWFRPFINALAKPMMESSMLGSNFRTVSGLVVSYADLGSDGYMIYSFWQAANVTAAYLSISFMLINTILQSILVYMQNMNMGRVVILTEILFVIFQARTAVDIYRVSTGAKQHKDETFPPYLAMIYNKSSEMFGEAIPSSVLQSYQLIKSVNRSKGAMLSLLLSAISIGFCSATLALDLDIATSSRKTNPRFYGYIPNTTRGLVFNLMVLFSSSQASMLTTGLALLFATNHVYGQISYGCGIFLFLLYKSLRRDLRYWFNFTDITSWIVSIIFRILEKVVGDFTSFLQLRHPYDFGGLGCMLNTVWIQISCFGGVHISTTETSLLMTRISFLQIW